MMVPSSSRIGGDLEAKLTERGMADHVASYPTRRENNIGWLLALLTAMPFAGLADLTFHYLSGSAIIGFVANLCVVMPMTWILPREYATRLARRRMRRMIARREAEDAERLKAGEVLTMQPWFAARIAERADPAVRTWLEQVETKAVRISDLGRSSTNASVVETLVDIDVNLRALAVDFMSARKASGEEAALRLDEEYLTAIEHLETSIDAALEIVEREARASFDTRLIHLKNRNAASPLGSIPDGHG
jgi:hypothetical protein